jgi:hypothetical protein
MSTRGELAVARLGAALLLFAVTACTAEERCSVPGLVTVCTCEDGSPGARVCAPENTFRACDCSGAIALPNPVRDSPGASGAGGAGGASGGAGAGGAAGRGGAGGATPPDDDAGLGPEPTAGSSADASVAGSGGSAGDAGTIDPLEAYRGCSTVADCEPDAAACTLTPSFPMNYSVCAPACIDTGDCPVPEGDYQAVVRCVTGICRLDCTPVLFAPLRTCPASMICIAPQLGVAFCHDDAAGMSGM